MLKENKDSKELKQDVEDSELILEAFRIRDFKRVLESNG
jgi:hypothetical protein